MKYIHTSFILLIAIVAFFSCGANDDDVRSVPYYQFQQEDLQFLLDSYNSPGNMLVFVNQTNEELSFQFKSFEQSKEDYHINSGLGPPSTFGPDLYYDFREIRYEFIQFNEPLADLRFTFSTFSGSLNGSIRFPLWNIDQYYTSTIPIEYDGNIFQMEINGNVYQDVIRLKSRSTSTEYEIGPFIRNVNILYYDLQLGLIGFDDVEGNEWRLQ